MKFTRVFVDVADWTYFIASPCRQQNNAMEKESKAHFTNKKTMEKFEKVRHIFELNMTLNKVVTKEKRVEQFMSASVPILAMATAEEKSPMNMPKLIYNLDLINSTRIPSERDMLKFAEKLANENDGEPLVEFMDTWKNRANSHMISVTSENTKEGVPEKTAASVTLQSEDASQGKKKTKRLVEMLQAIDAAWVDTNFVVPADEQQRKTILQVSRTIVSSSLHYSKSESDMGLEILMDIHKADETTRSFIAQYTIQEHAGAVLISGLPKKETASPPFIRLFRRFLIPFIIVVYCNSSALPASQSPELPLSVVMQLVDSEARELDLKNTTKEELKQVRVSDYWLHKFKDLFESDVPSHRLFFPKTGDSSKVEQPVEARTESPPPKKIFSGGGGGFGTGSAPRQQSARRESNHQDRKTTSCLWCSKQASLNRFASSHSISNCRFLPRAIREPNNELHAEAVEMEAKLKAIGIQIGK